MVTVTISEARASLPELINRVAMGDLIMITRHGQPVALVIEPSGYTQRQASKALADADRIGDLLSDAWAQELPTDPGISTDRAEELIAQIRAGRDESDERDAR